MEKVILTPNKFLKVLEINEEKINLNVKFKLSKTFCKYQCLQEIY